MRTVRCSGRLGRRVYPSMHWAGGCLPGGCLPGGACPRRGCIYLGGVCPGDICSGVCLPREVSAQGDVCPGGVCPGVSATPPPAVDRMTDACENITFPQLHYGLLLFSGGSRIFNIKGRAVANPGMGAYLLYGSNFTENYMKLKKMDWAESLAPPGSTTSFINFSITSFINFSG